MKFPPLQVVSAAEGFSHHGATATVYSGTFEVFYRYPVAETRLGELPLIGAVGGLRRERILTRPLG